MAGGEAKVKSEKETKNIENDSKAESKSEKKVNVKAGSAGEDKFVEEAGEGNIKADDDTSKVEKDVKAKSTGVKEAKARSASKDKIVEHC